MADEDESPVESESGCEGGPEPPDLPGYVVDPLSRQSPERLEAIASYARELAAWKRDGPPKPDGASNRGGVADEEADERGVDAPIDTAMEAGESDTERTDSQVDEAARFALAESEYEPEPASYDGVPSESAYITIKEPKPGYRYFYWQWRDGDTWKNQYVGPVDGE